MTTVNIGSGYFVVYFQRKDGLFTADVGRLDRSPVDRGGTLASSVAEVEAWAESLRQEVREFGMLKNDPDTY